VSANSRAGHKFNLDQVVDYGPKGASKFSKAWANAVAFAEWAEARQHEEAIAARCSHKQRRGGFGRPFFLALDGSAQFRCNHRRDSESFMISRIPKPITTSPNARPGNIIIGISNLLVRSPFPATLTVMSETGFMGALTDAILVARVVTEGGIGGGSGNATEVVAFS
jgi:hypothetical protein